MITSSCAVNTTWDGSICVNDTYPLSITKAGNGAGTVTSAPAGINCGATCSYSFNYNTSVTLTATPSTGSTFTGWSGGVCSGTGTCVTTMTAARSVTATFTLNQYTLTYTAGVGGTISGTTPQTVNYGANGTVVTAVPNANYHFTSWSDGILTAARTDTNITANKSVTASFTIDTYALSVTKAGTGTGTITSAPAGINCGATCSYSFNYNTSVTLTAVPDAGSSFTSWSGGGCSGTGTCVTTMTVAKNVTATFTGVTITITPTSTTYNTIPSTNISFTYTSTTNVGTTECRLLDFASSPLTSYQASSPIIYTPPSTAGTYGYYIQCRNTTNQTVTITSGLITVNVITVTVTASPTTYNTTPNTNVSFVYIATTNVGTTECLLLDNLLAPKTGYQLTSPIIFPSPNSAPGAYGYYVKCRNTTTTTAMANSALITVNTACLAGTSWNGSACVGPSGTVTASDCNISNNQNSCSSNITWSISNPIGNTSVTTPVGINVVAPTPLLSGATTWTVNYGSRDFYLYNNAIQRGMDTANATCTPGVNTWNAANNRCEPTTGTLTATGCTIAVDQTGCPSTLNWNTINPLTGIISILKNATSGTTVVTQNSGAIPSYNIGFGLTTFELWHNGVRIAQATATTSCANTTHWNGSKCVLDAPDDLNTTFTSDVTTIFEGKSANLTWNSPLATSCTGSTNTSELFNTGGVKQGTLKVTPKVTTTYTLTCSNVSGSNDKTATIKVITLIIKEQ